MNRVETLLIKEHGTMYPNGYNLLGGGDAPNEMAAYVKEKIREAQLNGANHMKGKKHKPETIEKMKAARKAQGNFRTGTKCTIESNQKRRDSMLGRKASNETKALLSKVHIGNKSALGHKLSDESKQKIRAKKLGKKHSIETKIKMSESHQRRIKERGLGHAEKHYF